MKPQHRLNHGFPAVDGLMMGTPCRAVDPGVILYAMQHHGMDSAAARRNG